MIDAIRSATHRLIGRVQGGLWPLRCLVSGRIVPGPGPLAVEHWQALHFLHGPECARCGAPLDEPLAAEPDTVCAACIAEPPLLRRMRAALAYDDASRPLVLSLKHGGERAGLTSFASWMARAAREVVTEADALIPVPLHPRRAAKRGFNQAEWLARALSTRTLTPVDVRSLRRVKASRHAGGQGTLSARERKANVARAFRVDTERAAFVLGRRLVLIDDVLTTGATANACASALLEAGAKHVDLVTLARVVRPRELSI